MGRADLEGWNGEQQGGTANPEWTIQVMTKNGVPIEGALVTSSPELGRLGITAASGDLVLCSAGAYLRGIGVFAAGYVARELKVPHGATQVLRVRMMDAASIRGVVRTTERPSIGPGASVLAVSPLYYLQDRAVEAAFSGTPLISMTETDEEGRFLLPGLQPGVPYRIWAAAGGFVSFDEGKAYLAGEDDGVELVARPVYGVRVRLMDEDDVPVDMPGPIELDPRIFPTEVHADGLYMTKWTTALLGLNPDQGGEDRSIAGPFCLVAHEDHGDSIRVRYRVNIPGYHEIDALLEARRVSLEIPECVVRASRSCTGFGEVAVIATPPSRVEELLDAMGPSQRCRLRLRRLDSGDQVIAALHFSPAGMEVVPSIPHGDYSVEFEGPHGWFSYPDNTQAPVSVRVGPTPAVIEVPIPDRGVVEVVVKESDGLDYSGPLMWSLRRLEDDAMEVFYSPSGPYTMPLIPWGDYEMGLYGMGVDRESRIVTVQANKLASVACWTLER